MMTKFERFLLFTFVVFIAISVYKPRVQITIQDCQRQPSTVETE